MKEIIENLHAQLITSYIQEQINTEPIPCLNHPSSSLSSPSPCSFLFLDLITVLSSINLGRKPQLPDQLKPLGGNRLRHRLICNEITKSFIGAIQLAYIGVTGLLFSHDSSKGDGPLLTSSNQSSCATLTKSARSATTGFSEFVCSSMPRRSRFAFDH